MRRTDAGDPLIRPGAETGARIFHSRWEFQRWSGQERVLLFPQLMTLVNSLCAEINVFQGIGERTGIVVERSAIRGRKTLCKSMRDLTIKSRVLGDGYYYVPSELWPPEEEPVVLTRHDWTVIGSIPRTNRPRKRSSTQVAE